MSGVAALLRGCPRFVHELAVLVGRFVVGIMPGTIVLSPRYALGARLPLRIWRAVCTRFTNELAVLAGRFVIGSRLCLRFCRGVLRSVCNLPVRLY